MKKILLLSIITFSLNAYSQFTLTPNGFVDSNKNDQKFTVVPIADKSSEELYKLAMIAINTIYKSGESVSSRVENEMINIHGIEENAAVIKMMGLPFSFYADYNIIIRFKDNKIRFEPIINKMYDLKGNILGLCGKPDITGKVNYVFKKDGSVKYPSSKESIETTINGIVNLITSSIKKEKNTIDEW